MRPRSCRTRAAVLAVLLLLLLLPAGLLADHRLEARPDSLATLLGLDLEKEGLEELPGVGAVDFRLYTTGERSILSWQIGDVLYVYPLAGGDHARLGLDLLDALRTNGLFTFVSRREGDRLRYTPARAVVALQVRTVQLRAFPRQP